MNPERDPKHTFRLAVDPSPAHASHLIVDVDLKTGQVTLGAPLRADEIPGIMSSTFKGDLGTKELLQLVLILYSRVSALEQHLGLAAVNHGPLNAAVADVMPKAAEEKAPPPAPVPPLASPPRPRASDPLEQDRPPGASWGPTLQG